MILIFGVVDKLRRVSCDDVGSFMLGRVAPPRYGMIPVYGSGSNPPSRTRQTTARSVKHNVAEARLLVNGKRVLRQAKAKAVELLSCANAVSQPGQGLLCTLDCYQGRADGGVRPMFHKDNVILVDLAAELAATGLTQPEEIGCGGFGVVYRCWQKSLDRAVAVKVWINDLDDENVERFVREQRAMVCVSGHPNIVSIFEVGRTDGGRPFIVMQYQPHGSLESLIRKGGPLAVSDTLRLGIKLAGALETAHQAGVMHRDVRPTNILSPSTVSRR